MLGVWVIADHLQREVGLDAGAHVEGAAMEQRPTAMHLLHATKIDTDQTLKLVILRLASKMAQQHVFGRYRGVGLQLEAPMSVRMLTLQQRRRSHGNVAIECLKRERILRRVKRDGHGETSAAMRVRGATARISLMIEAAL